MGRYASSRLPRWWANQPKRHATPRRHGWSRSRPSNEYATGHFHLAARSVHAGDRPPSGTAGRDGPATPPDVAGQLQSGGFFWLDLENPGDDELAEFGHSLQLSAGAIDSVTHASQRSSFTLAAGSVQAVLPAAVGTGPAAWLEANYVTLLLTGQFLLTVHATPAPALQHARHQYRGLEEDARADEVRLLFLVTDVLIGSFRPQLLAIDDRLGEIQLGMLRGVSPKVHDELVKIRSSPATSA